MNVMNELDHLKERINKKDADAMAQQLISLMKSLKFRILKGRKFIFALVVMLNTQSCKLRLEN